MISLKNIKLVIWDLDDTFWLGTLSEEEVTVVPQNVAFVRTLTDCGIINSICSKNEEHDAIEKLESIGIRDMFVFPSINWENKAGRLKSQIELMALRPVNVLFIDDNHFNREEARHLLPDIQTCGPEEIPELSKQIDTLDKKDLQHKRLQQYKVLEAKNLDKLSFSSNEDFLYASNIRVSIKHDCLEVIDRLHELILRSNQLNFTKKRDSFETLRATLEDKEYNCGYVEVKDNYGDYGIIGFYALTQNRLEHFVFSCRTMGQKIEQYVYATLGFPEITVVGEVRTELNKYEIPEYINRTSTASDNKKELQNVSSSVLLKGPCDMSHALMYLKNRDAIDTEFTYVKAGTNKTIDAYNHSVHILGLKTLSQSQIEEIINDCPFVDRDMFSSSFFSKEYDVIFLSSLIESIRGVYRKKGTDIRVAFGPRKNPVTDPSNWNGYIQGSYYSGGAEISETFLQDFSDKYAFEGATSPKQYVEFLKQTLNWLPERTTLCIILGATYPLPGEEAHSAYHRGINKAVKELAANTPRLKFIEMDNIASKPDDFCGNINHFSSRVYYSLASAMVDIMEISSGIAVHRASRSKVAFITVLNVIRGFMKKHLSKESRTYHALKKVYLCLTGKKDNVK